MTIYYGKIQQIFWCLMVILLTGCGNTPETENQQSTNQSSGTNMPIGVALYSFNRFPFAESLDKSKEAGVAWVEGFFFHNLGPDFDEKRIPDLSIREVDELNNMIEEADLHMPSMYAGGNTIEEWEEQFKKADELGLSFLVGEPAREMWGPVHELAAKYDVRLAIHQHAQGHSIFWHPDSVLAAIEGHENFGACGDLGHWVRSGLDPVECLKALEGHLISIHAKDLDEFGNIDANDIKLGTGVIDYPAVMAELKRQNFQGPIFVECEHDWEDNLEDVKFAVEYLEKLK